MSTANLAQTYHRRYAAIDRLSRRWPRDPSEWLTPAEQEELDRLRDERRLQSWLAGRWLAKGLVVECAAGAVGHLPKQIEILTRRADGRSERPRVRLAGEPLAVSLSISHEGNGVLAVLAPAGVSIGCDLVVPATMSVGFRQVWFNAGELAWLETQPPEVASIAWGVKEAVYKAANRGESFVPRGIVLDCPTGDRCTARFEHRANPTATLDDGQTTRCTASWRVERDHVAVVAITQGSR